MCCARRRPTACLQPSLLRGGASPSANGGACGDCGDCICCPSSTSAVSVSALDTVTTPRLFLEVVVVPSVAGGAICLASAVCVEFCLPSRESPNFVAHGHRTPSGLTLILIASKSA